MDMLLPSDDNASPSYSPVTFGKQPPNKTKRPSIRSLSDCKGPIMKECQKGTGHHHENENLNCIVEKSTYKDLARNLGAGGIMSMLSESSPMRGIGSELTASNRLTNLRYGQNASPVNGNDVMMKTMNGGISGSPLLPKKFSSNSNTAGSDYPMNRKSLTGQYNMPYHSQSFRKEHMVQQPQFPPINNQSGKIKQKRHWPTWKNKEKYWSSFKTNMSSPTAYRIYKILFTLSICIALLYIIYLVMVFVLIYAKLSRKEHRVIM